MNDGLLGFNGERPDPVSGVTHLGNGYRASHPPLMRFNAPDSMSPFGHGGINPYAYCAGDPVNRTDPSGHISLGQWMGLGVGLMAGITLSIVTGGAALTVATALLADVAGGAAIGAGAELVTEAVDGQQVNWGQVGIAAGAGAAAALVGYGVGKTSLLNDASNRPFGSLMLEGGGVGGQLGGGPAGQFRAPRFIGIFTENEDQEHYMALSFIDRFNGHERLNMVGPASMSARNRLSMGSGSWNGHNYEKECLGSRYISTLIRQAVVNNPEIRTVRLAIPYAGKSISMINSFRSQVYGYLRRSSMVTVPDVTAPLGEFTVDGPAADILDGIVRGLHFEQSKGLIAAGGQQFNVVAAQSILNLISDDFADIPNAFRISYNSV